MLRRKPVTEQGGLQRRDTMLSVFTAFVGLAKADLARRVVMRHRGRAPRRSMRKVRSLIGRIGYLYYPCPVLTPKTRSNRRQSLATEVKIPCHGMLSKHGAFKPDGDTVGTLRALAGLARPQNRPTVRWLTPSASYRLPPLLCHQRRKSRRSSKHLKAGGQSSR